jgi:hypothetical protein
MRHRTTVGADHRRSLDADNGATLTNQTGNAHAERTNGLLIALGISNLGTVVNLGTLEKTSGAVQTIESVLHNGGC